MFRHLHLIVWTSQAKLHCPVHLTTASIDHGVETRSTAVFVDTTAKQASLAARDILYQRFTALRSHRWRYLRHHHSDSSCIASNTSFERTCARILLETHPISFLPTPSSPFRTLESCQPYFPTTILGCYYHMPYLQSVKLVGCWYAGRHVVTDQFDSAILGTTFELPGRYTWSLRADLHQATWLYRCHVRCFGHISRRSRASGQRKLPIQLCIAVVWSHCKFPQDLQTLQMLTALRAAPL